MIAKRPSVFARSLATLRRWERNLQRAVFGKDIRGGLWRLALVAGAGPAAFAAAFGMVSVPQFGLMLLSGLACAGVAFGVFGAPLIRAVGELAASATSTCGDIVPETPELSAESLRTVGARIQEAAADQRSAQDELWRRAYFDQLTGVPNRAFLTDRLTSALTMRASRPTPLAVLIMDVDGFKGLNDTLGHAAGDAFLAGFAGRLRMLARRNGVIVGRLGGDEFAMLVDRPDAREEAVNLAESIGRMLSRPFIIEGREIRLSASVGIGITASGQTTLQAILRAADEALYDVKAAGKASHALRLAA